MEKVYLIRLENTNDYKIGYSKDPEQRIRGLQTANGGKLELIETVETEFGFKLESHLHRHYSLKRKLGEWFELDEGDILKFKEICKKQEEVLSFLAENNTYIQNKGKKW
jgi:hypothetical protein